MDFLDEIDAIQVENWMSIIQDHTDALNRMAEAMDRNTAELKRSHIRINPVTGAPVRGNW